MAEVGGKVVGFMLGEVRGGEFGLEEPTGWVEFFGVDPNAREKGVGRSLIEALLARFKAKGAHVARTMVRAQDKEIDAFIRRMGFTPAPVARLLVGQAREHVHLVPAGDEGRRDLGDVGADPVRSLRRVLDRDEEDPHRRLAEPATIPASVSAPSSAGQPLPRRRPDAAPRARPAAPGRPP